MKICIVSLNIVPFFRGGASDRYGGAEAQAAFIAGALRDAGHDVHLVVSDLHEGDQVPFPVENAFDPRAGIPGLRFLHPRWTGIARALERADADVYLQRNAGMITGLTAMFCRKNDKVFVYAGGSDVDFSPRRVSINNVRDRMLHSYGLKLCDGFVVQNESQKQAALSRFDKPVRVIPNGVHPLVAAEKNSREYVLWIGGWRSIKRPDIILDIAERLPEIKFAIVGGPMAGEDDVAAEITHRADGLDNVELTGTLPRSEVQAILGRASMLVNTSSFEGFPNAYLEAWSCGVPVVTVNDVDNIIKDEAVGVVCGSAEELVTAIRSLAGDSEALGAMAARARELITRRFSPQAIVSEYIDYFGALVERRRHRKSGKVERG